MNNLRGFAVGAFLLACGAVGIYIAYSLHQAWQADKTIQACADAIANMGDGRADAIRQRCDSLPRGYHLLAVDLAAEKMGISAQFKEYQNARR